MCAVAMIPAVISVAATAASTGMQAAASAQKGKAEQEQAEANARLAEQQAHEVKVRGVHEARRAEAEGRRTAATAQAIAGGTGIGGRAVESAVAQSFYNSQVDADTIRSNAARSAWGYKMEADQSRRRGTQAREAGYLGATSAVLGGVGSMASQSKAFF